MLLKITCTNELGTLFYKKSISTTSLGLTTTVYETSTV